MTEEDQLRELGRLYNYRDDDSPQFTRWQMLVAIRHGINLSQASPPPLDDETAVMPRDPTQAMIARSWLPDVRDLKSGQPIDACFVWRAMFDAHLGVERDPLSSCRIGTDGEALSLHKADRHDD